MFFYNPALDRRDIQFRRVVQAMFEESPGHAGDDKAPWLARLKAEGIYLIDLVPYPAMASSGLCRRPSRTRLDHTEPPDARQH
jgi:hypothetical protein